MPKRHQNLDGHRAAGSSRITCLFHDLLFPSAFFTLSLLALIFFTLIFAFGCKHQSAASEMKQNPGNTFALSSGSFGSGDFIPKKFTCDGADISPQLSWTFPPLGTKAFALVVDDPDAPSGTWTHWVLFNVPASKSALSENLDKIPELPDGGRQGKNDFGKIGFNGPCPPPGKAHRYFFRLYALKENLTLPAASSKQDVEQAIKNHLLGQTQLVGKYQR